MQRNFDRQIATVRNLETPPYGYELTAYAVEEWAGNHVAVTRQYKIVGGNGKTAWHELVKIGPRGSVKTIYKNFY